MAGDVIAFNIVREGDGYLPKPFELKANGGKTVRIGRAPGNDMTIEFRGCSQYHCELRFLPDSNGKSRLICRDLSTNGTGIKRIGDKQAIGLTKDVDNEVPDGASLLVPMMLKANLSQNDRAWLKIEYVSTKSRNRNANGKATPAAIAEATGENEAAAEKNRMQFVELLLKTREISSGTTYDEAQRTLQGESAWRSVDEQTRRECFEIFVDHLSSSNKKEKKKDKGKSKKDKHRNKGVEEAPRRSSPTANAASPERARKRRRDEKDRRQGSGSRDHHRKSKQEKKVGERERERSRSGARRERKRRP